MTKYEKAAREAQVELETSSIDRTATADAPPSTGQAPGRKPKALLVVHGIGQQLRFETLDTISNGLFKEDVRRHGTVPAEKPRASHVKVGNQRLERVEMTLRAAPGADPQPVHVYEAYWSPLTEGAVTLRDAVRFLFRAGLNGIRNSRGRFLHWAFGQKQTRNVPVQTMVFLLLALGVVAALVVINTAIVLVPAARSPFAESPKWLSDMLFRDLTDLFNATLIVLLGFGALLFGSMLASRWHTRQLPRVLLGILCAAGFALALFAVLAAGVTVPLLITLHGGAQGATSLLPDIVRLIGQWTPYIVLGIAALAIILVVGQIVSSLLHGWFHQLGTGRKWTRVVGSSAVILVFALMVYGLVDLARDLMAAANRSAGSKTLGVLFEAPVWAALVGIGMLVRSFVVQYVGDVAAYVESHTIDRFYELRMKIKDCAWKTANAIYSHKSDGQHFDYDEIVIAGHSLGSVLAYDTLNRLLLDDEVGGSLNVSERTRMLLTFGSPLDKTAFVFANQSKGKQLTPSREALGAVMQPLIDNKAVREKVEWVNVHSPWDIISGPLDYYDDPSWTGPPNQKPRVINEVDPQALTLLAAHTEFWRNWHVFARIYGAVNPRGPALDEEPGEFAQLMQRMRAWIGSRTKDGDVSKAGPDAKAA